MKTNIYWLSAISVATTSALLSFFIVIAQQGYIYAQEPSAIILYGEIFLLIALIVYSLWTVATVLFGSDGKDK